MTHDNLCDYIAGDPTRPVCICPWIAKVRADEREEVIDRQKAAMFNDFRTNADGNLVLYWETAVAAARGDGEQA